jgi:hypothetical protein
MSPSDLLFAIHAMVRRWSPKGSLAPAARFSGDTLGIVPTEARATAGILLPPSRAGLERTWSPEEQVRARLELRGLTVSYHPSALFPPDGRAHELLASRYGRRAASVGSRALREGPEPLDAFGVKAGKRGGHAADPIRPPSTHAALAGSFLGRRRHLSQEAPVGTGQGSCRRSYGWEQLLGPLTHQAGTITMARW